LLVLDDVMNDREFQKSPIFSMLMIERHANLNCNIILSSQLVTSTIPRLRVFYTHVFQARIEDNKLQKDIVKTLGLEPVIDKKNIKITFDDCLDDFTFLVVSMNTQPKVIHWIKSGTTTTSWKPTEEWKHYLVLVDNDLERSRPQTFNSRLASYRK
jgi:hypothetical protein